MVKSATDRCLPCWKGTCFTIANRLLQRLTRQHRIQPPPRMASLHISQITADRDIRGFRSLLVRLHETGRVFMLAQPLDQARDCREGASNDYRGEFGERPHADSFGGPGFVKHSSQVHAVDQTDDARNAGPARAPRQRTLLSGYWRISQKPHAKHGRNDHFRDVACNIDCRCGQEGSIVVDTSARQLRIR